jgi:hypothetical protein
VLIRALQMRSLRVTRVAVPLMLVTVAMSVGNAQGPAIQASAAADQQAVGSATPRPAAAAAPVIVPLDVPASAMPGSEPHYAAGVAQPKAPPVASAPIAKLPVHLDTRASSIPLRVLSAYVAAAALERQADAQCHLRWQTLAGIGFIESDHARSGGSENPNWNGVAKPPIFGPLLADKVRAVGPMQFLPSTWAIYGADGNGDGVDDPQDIDDATLAAADYLCAVSPDLNQPKHLIRAIFAYNHSYAYVRAVLTVTAHYMNINPAKLGINGLPKRHRRRISLHLAPPVAPPPYGAPKSHSSPTATPTPTPTGSPSSSPSPSPTPKPTPRPTPTRSWSPRPSPTPTPTPTPRLPRH